ncbi:hypothetical protein KsCSTR_04800 [Candidatus Kuenenia stuttgartiensis]|jgi:hypothetical protein|uniref:Uncharacterized protein n=1 Tax=Kuenenia stuttgartiensis TaxID=174633 RepID=A0A2C9CEZ4_KUEST|nr:hypothetical protein KsCSTR_04800 [Candidatus Kuenenia stuttgartiensis]SOH04260.1 hypothetical protein KSMBR1_1761 [Candidatus Kuenenia stuttgartiensis]
MSCHCDNNRRIREFKQRGGEILKIRNGLTVVIVVKLNRIIYSVK